MRSQGAVTVDGRTKENTMISWCPVAGGDIRQYHAVLCSAGNQSGTPVHIFPALWQGDNFAGDSVDGDTQEHPRFPGGPGVLAIPKGPSGIEVRQGKPCGMGGLWYVRYLGTDVVPSEKLAGSTPARQQSTSRPPSAPFPVRFATVHGMWAGRGRDSSSQHFGRRGEQ